MRPSPAISSLDGKLRCRIEELSEAFANTEEGRNVSDFWQRIVREHLELLESEGFERFKQTLNFKYSQWCVTTLVDRKFWRMQRTHLSALGVPSRWLDTHYGPNPKRPRWPYPVPGAATIYKLFVSALWDYAERNDKLGILSRVPEASLGSPIPLYRGPTLLSQDLALSSLEINRIAEHLDFSSIRSVLEIGGGYGRLAYVFRKLLPNVEYHIVDIPPTLAISELYLTTLFGAEGFHFHLPVGLKSLPSGHFDLVLNVSSFDEMKASQAHAYLAEFADKGRGIAYLKGHGKRDPATGRRGILEFDYPPGWVELYRGGDPFQRTFNELVFRLPAK
jgi:putative sugar O-methyltransferase